MSFATSGFLVAIETDPESKAIYDRFHAIFERIDKFLESHPDENIKKELDALKELYPLTITKCDDFFKKIREKVDKFNSPEFNSILVNLKDTVKSGQEYVARKKE